MVNTNDIDIIRSDMYDNNNINNMKKIRYFSNQEDIIFLGDTHGSMKNFFYNCKIYKLENKVVFHVGDFGAGFQKNCKEWLQLINDELAEKNIIMYVIRGNHDDPIFFNGDYINTNLKLMPDYTTVTVGDRRFLLVGGAISVDRIIRRTEHLSQGYITWWEDEEFVLNKRKLAQYKGITDVITHSAPNIAPPNGPFPGFIYNNVTKGDDTLIKDIVREREMLTEMYDILIRKNRISRWYYGHFHSHDKVKINDTNFILLDVNELL